MNSHTRLTYQDFLKFPDDEQRHELIDGEHFVTPSPNIQHQRLVVRLTVALSQYLDQHSLGQVFCAPLDCVLSEFDVVEPDVFVVLKEQEQILTDTHVRGGPAIVIEILSSGTSRRDLGIKRDLYERGGVREYWIVDPVGETLRVCSRSTDRSFTEVAELSASTGSTLTTPLLPGFALSLPEFFRADR